MAGAAAGSLVVLGGGAERQPWLFLIAAGAALALSAIVAVAMRRPPA